MEETDTQTPQTITLLGRSQVSQSQAEPSKLEHISQGDYSRPTVLRQKVKAYQQRMAEQDQLVQRQKKQNDRLKQQLKELNNSLSAVIERQHPLKEPKKKEEPEQKKLDLLQKELDNAKKQVAIYQREVASLKAKLDACGAERTTKLQNDLKQREQQIEQLNAKIKLLERSEKIYNNSDLGKLNEQLTSRVNALTEEIGFLRKKLAEAKKNEQQQQKNLKKRSEYIISLEMKSRETLNSTKEAKHEKKEIVAAPQQTENLKLLQNIESLEYSKQVLEKKLRTDTELLKSKNRQLEEQNNELKEKLTNKQKELSISNFKVNELKRKAPGSTLEPLDNFRRSLDVSQHNVFERRKEFKGLTNTSAAPRKFDDSLSLGIQRHYRIAKLTFTFLDDHILSLSTDYEMLEGQRTTKTINSFTIAHQHPTVSTTEIVFEGYEYIKQLEGLCGKHIEWLQFTTSRGSCYTVGSDRNQAKCKRISYDIRNNEKPVAVMGIIDNKKRNKLVLNVVIGGEFSDVLVSFGLELKKKEVVLGKQPSQFTTYSKPGYESVKRPAKSSYGEEPRQTALNDKNVLNE